MLPRSTYVVCTAKCSLAQILAGKIQVEDWLMGVGTTYLSRCKSKESKQITMASLLCDVHFWTIREDVVPKDTDQSTFKYYDKNQHKSMLERPYGQDKLTFSQGRGQMSLIESKRLKSSLKEFDEILAEHSVIFSAWRTPSFYQVIEYFFGCRTGGSRKNLVGQVLRPTSTR